MPYLGFQPNIGSIVQLDSLSLDGSTSEFFLYTNGDSHHVGDQNELIVSRNGVIQRPGTDFFLSGGGLKIAFSTVPASTESIFIIHMSGVKGSGIPDDKSVTEEKLADSLKSYTEQTFTGNSNTTSFSLNFTPASSGSLMVTVDGLVKDTSQYTVSNTTLYIDNNGTPYTANNTIRVLDLGIRGLQRLPPKNSITEDMLADGAFNTATVRDVFTTDGVLSSYTLSKQPYSTHSVLVFVDGIYQHPVTDYTVTGTTLSFTYIPVYNNKIVVLHLNNRTKDIFVQPTNNSVTDLQLVDGAFTTSKLNSNFFCINKSNINYDLVVDENFNALIAGPINITSEGSIQVNGVLNII